MVFGYYKNNRCVGYKVHKKYTSKGLSCRYYPNKKINFERVLWIVAGEKDRITMHYRFNLKNCITSSAGENSIPKVNGKYDIAFFSKCKSHIYIIYDNDDSGYAGAKKLAYEINSKYPEIIVRIHKWRKGLKEKFDATDAYIDDSEGGREIFNNINKVPYILPKETMKTTEEAGEYIGYNILSGKEIFDAKFKETKFLIDYIVAKDSLNVLGGAEGSGKSFMAIQMGLSIAGGLPLFNQFEVLEKSPVLLIQFENANYDMQQRLLRMYKSIYQKYSEEDWFDNFKYCPMPRENEVFVDNWKRIKATIEKFNFRNGTVIIDNVYTSTDRDLSQSEEYKYVLRDGHQVKNIFGNTIILVAHPNKQVCQDDLIPGDLQGGAVMKSFVSVILQIHTSALNKDLKIMKITKGGRSKNNVYEKRFFKVFFDEDFGGFTYRGLVDKSKPHFSSKDKTSEMKLAVELSRNPILSEKTFTRKEFVDNLPDAWVNRLKHKNQVTRKINDMVALKLFEKVNYNEYQLTDAVYESDDDFK